MTSWCVYVKLLGTHCANCSCRGCNVVLYRNVEKNKDSHSSIAKFCLTKRIFKALFKDYSKLESELNYSWVKDGEQIR